jgi:hypothetical protein
VIRPLARSAALLAAVLALGALGAATPRVAMATPSLDGCTGVLAPPTAEVDRIEVWEPGIWCLDQDMTSDQYDSTYTLIAIVGDDITIDCRGHRLTYTGLADNSNGIASSLGTKRATVRNCRIRGFGRGIGMYDNAGYLVEDNVVEGGGSWLFETPAGIVAFGGGIVRRNRVSGTQVHGIRVSGDAAVVDNVVDGVTDTLDHPQPAGISHGLPGTAEIRGNTVRGLREDPAYNHGLGVIGVAVEGYPGATGRVTIADNVLVHDGSANSVAFACGGHPQSHYSDNVATGFESTSAGCTDAGDNDPSP